MMTQSRGAARSRHPSLALVGPDDALDPEHEGRHPGVDVRPGRAAGRGHGQHAGHAVHVQAIQLGQLRLQRRPGLALRQEAG